MAIAGNVVNEEVAEVTTELEEWQEADENDERELDMEQVKAGRKEEMDFILGKLEMFEFGSYEEAVNRGGKVPTTTKWVEGWEADEGGG